MPVDERNAVGPITWVLTREELKELREAVLNSVDCVVDLETTGLNEHAYEGGPYNGGVGARIVLASFTLPQSELGPFGERQWDQNVPVTWVLPLSHPDSPFRSAWRNAVRFIFEPAIEAKIPMSNQNIKFDARWLNATCGMDITNQIDWDTKDAWHLLDETRSTKLKVRVPQDFGIPPWNDFPLDYPGAAEKVNLIDLGIYAAHDTWWTWRGKQRQQMEMFLGDVEEPPFDEDDRINARLGKLAGWVAMPTVASLTKIEQRGIRLDLDWVSEHLREDEQIARDSLDELADYAHLSRDNASTASASYWFRDLTTAAINNGDLAITAMTEKGNPTWSRIVLQRQARAGSKIAELILRQRRSAKRAEFMRSWMSLQVKGVIYAQFNSGSVSTGRLSSSEPNLQQVTKSLRPAFIPREGFVMADFDYSQVELRVAAFISRCQPMIEAFREGADLHRRFAAVINQVEESEVTAEQRQQAKAGNFGLLYEMGAFGFKEYAETAYGVILTMEEAVRIHSAFFTMWDGMRKWHNDVKSFVHAHGYVVSPLGRVRRLPNIWDGNDKLVSFAERQAINSPVQSMGSDLLQLSMASMQGLLHESVRLPAIPDVFPLATVHDSIVAEIREDNWEETAKAVKNRMESLDEVLDKFGVHFDLPLIADATVGTRWSLHDVSDPEPEDSEKEVLSEAASEMNELAELIGLGA